MTISRMNKGIWGKVHAFFDVKTTEGFIIKGFRLVEGINGKFVAMPSTKGQDGEFYDTVLADKEIQEKILGLLDKDLDWRGAHDVILNKNIIESCNGGIARGLYVKGTKGFWSDEENLT